MYVPSETVRELILVSTDPNWDRSEASPENRASIGLLSNRFRSVRPFQQQDAAAIDSARAAPATATTAESAAKTSATKTAKTFAASTATTAT